MPPFFSARKLRGLRAFRQAVVWSAVVVSPGLAAPGADDAAVRETVGSSATTVQAGTDRSAWSIMARALPTERLAERASDPAVRIPAGSKRRGVRQPAPSARAHLRYAAADAAAASTNHLYLENALSPAEHPALHPFSTGTPPPS